MEILSHLNRVASQIGAPYVVIGGHAVTAHGFSRNTGDLDLVVASSASDQWCAAVQKLGYALFNKSSVFAQFKSERLDGWPIDLMFVEDETFAQLLQKAVNFQFNQAQAKIASIPHLIAMKLHALKRRPEHRERKDLDDVDNLLRIQSTPTTDQDFRQLCIKYDTLWVYEELNKKNS